MADQPPPDGQGGDSRQAGQDAIEVSVAILRGAVGVKGPELKDRVEAGAIRKFALAVGDSDPLRAPTLAPPTFLLSFRAALEVPAVPFGSTSLNGANAIELIHPVWSGDEITAQAEISDVSATRGRSGPMLLIERQTRYVNQDGVLVAVSKGTSIRREPAAKALGSRAAAVDDGAAHAAGEVTCLVKEPTTRQLVRYAGAAGDFNEIHYDHHAALRAGLPGVIIHGALKFAWLAELVTRWAGADRALRTLSAQYRGVDQPGRPYRLCCAVEGSTTGGETTLLLWGEGSQGRRTTVGSATVIDAGRGATA